MSPLIPVAAQLSFPIHSDPAYHSIPGDTLVRQQLSVWGISIGPVGIEPTVDLMSITRGSLASTPDLQADPRRSRVRSRGLGLSLRATLGLTSGLSNTVDNVNLTSHGASSGWGSAENVAKGEQGDTEVSIM